MAALVSTALALSACGSAGSSAPGAVSEGEAQALEEAAEMLDERRLPEGALPPVGAVPPPAAPESPSQAANPNSQEQADSE
ncbi:hypothetical protein [Qipengyuania sp. ASV99]|uniref:hypothetical protein n=1 Tax=Qipengyuania sp. ASV99 TaxID=3399681 RepID=UPI003A4C546E